MEKEIMKNKNFRNNENNGVDADYLLLINKIDIMIKTGLLSATDKSDVFPGYEKMAREYWATI